VDHGTAKRQGLIRYGLYFAFPIPVFYEEEIKMASDIERPVDNNLEDSIAMLEQILEVMPQDGMALKALYNAYYKSGHADQALEYLRRLVDVVLGAGDMEMLQYVQHELKNFEEEYPSRVAELLERLATIVPATAKAQHVQTPKTAPSAQKDRAGDISEELALAWRLYEENQLSQEEYSSVLHDLTETSSKELDVPVSVLHVLNDRGFTQMKRIMNYLSERSGVPCISLSCFELDDDAVSLLPIKMAAHDGALPFAVLGDDLLLAVLNPFNSVLVDKAEKLCGRRCHTYLVGPEEYDAALGRIRQQLAKAA